MEIITIIYFSNGNISVYNRLEKKIDFYLLGLV